ncbi:MAG: hypothetical protein ABSH28_19650 [Acidobacteriota bacterium]|jgi:hypothetical protein
MAKSALSCFAAALIWAAAAQAAEPLAGSWVLTANSYDSKPAPVTIPLGLKVTESGGSLQFQYSMNGGQLITMVFAARMDGSEVDVKDGTGKRIGSAIVHKVSANDYELVLKSPGAPDSPGKMTVSNGGNTLTCESTTRLPGHDKPTKVTQVFTRQ